MPGFDFHYLVRCKWFSNSVRTIVGYR